MSTAAPASVEAALGRRFEALIFDWDGTAVPDRRADASTVRRLVEELCALGMKVAVVSGTHVGNIDGQLAARPRGPGSLHLLLNRGSEAFSVDERGPELVERRTATPQEDEALDAAAALTVERLAQRGLDAEIVSERLNRRKIDLIPLPEWADPPKARIADLLAAVEERLRERGIGGLAEAVAIAESAAADSGLPEARVTSDAKHVEIGLTDKSDSARWMLAELWRGGVGPGLVLIAGDEMGPLGGLTGSDANLLIPEAARATAVSVGVEPEGLPDPVVPLGGGPRAFVSLLADQLARRRHGAVPRLDGDPSWTLAIDGIDPRDERAHESLLTLADGRIGTRGTPLGDHPATAALVISGGVYRGAGPESELQPGPLWNRLPFDIESGVTTRRALDLRTGLMRQELSGADGHLEAILFSSISRPGTVVLRAGSELAAATDDPLCAPGADVAVESEDAGPGRQWMWVGGHSPGLGAAARETIAGEPGAPSRDRIAAYRAGAGADSARKEALAALSAAEAEGFERLLVAQRSAWADRWTSAGVEIEGDPELQLAVRVALYHLMASTASSGEAAVGARGLTGTGYRGHVFWDSEVFVLPFLAATHPAAARAILEYRVRRLPAAQRAARALGLAGARFAWESAADGVDVTPRAARDRAGREVAIHTGEREEHIVADVAWAAGCYQDWTGDEAFRAGPGRALFVETARYWASRAERDGDGRAHIRGVIGPDEYHELVDDNAFTNVMARWNLRRAHAETTDSDIEASERASWLDTADALVDGYRPEDRLYEQFAGFFELEPLVIAELAPRRPIAADLLLSRDRVERAQVVKQADVLMLHHLVPDEVDPESLEANLDFYEPRTAHASSLSPGVHASLFARAGRLDEALAALSLTARIDLDDISESTAGGVHIAAMGSLWQALALGFAGARPDGERLGLHPRLPDGWEGLALRLRFRGAAMTIRVSPEATEVACDRPTRIAVAGSEAVTVGPKPHVFESGSAA